jgi:arginyl-tRNA synthetase
MTNIISLFKNNLYDLIDELESKKVITDFNKNSLSVDYSSKSKKGDLSSNILLILRKKNLNIKFNLDQYVSNFFTNIKYIEKIEIAKAGFVNISIKKNFLIDAIKNLMNNQDYKNEYLAIKKEKINIEFVSANPTGPIHVAHIRGAVLGDVLSSILESIGHEVTREYYVNDAGSQIKILGNSLFKRYQQLFNIKVELSKDEYPGNYLIDIAEEIKKKDGDKWISNKNKINLNDYFESYATNFLIYNIKDDLSLININFDKFTFESQIVKNKLIDKVFLLLKEKNLIYEGILDRPLGDDDDDWEPRKQLLFRSTNFSDDSDRAFKKANGEWTYFANDSAYHYDKYERGYDKLINIWGADHIGYVKRMKSIVDAATNKNNYLDVFICQIVRLIKNNKILKMSKREGNFITLKAIHDKVGTDALRYFMISSKSETSMDFDMDKVIEKNKDNPVFYCQYAYARASSVIRKASEMKNIPNLINSLNLFNEATVSEYEWQIILKILFWPNILLQAAENKQPHRITLYLEDLCSHFHSFWNKGKDDISLRMLDENNIEKTITKLIWIKSFKIVLNNAFKIIGISSPEIM